MAEKLKPDLVRVTQADREIAAGLYGEGSLSQAAIRSGSWDATEIVQAFARYRISVLEEAAKVAESEPGILSGHRSGGSFGAARADQCKIIATAIRSLSQPVEGSAGASEESHD